MGTDNPNMRAEVRNSAKMLETWAACGTRGNTVYVTRARVRCWFQVVLTRFLDWVFERCDLIIELIISVVLRLSIKHLCHLSYVIKSKESAFKNLFLIRTFIQASIENSIYFRSRKANLYFGGRKNTLPFRIYCWSMRIFFGCFSLFYTWCQWYWCFQRQG